LLVSWRLLEPLAFITSIAEANSVSAAVVHHSERGVVVELQQCTGEPVERLESDDRAVIAYLQGVGSDLDLT
jgi:hypothetical protein